MVPANFLTATPWQWLQHFPRYFNAIDARLTKLPSGGLNRDQQLSEELDNWQQWIDSLQQERAADPEVVQLRWMIEEYRVSLFAQQLGTAMTISSRRLEKQLEKIQR
jgi:ATP-dependent helicase HrpA